MLYSLAMVSGFRASELASLHPESFDLDNAQPTVTVQAGYSKRRRRDTQPLPLGVAAALRVYLAGKSSGQPIWPGNWPDRAADMLRVDLEAARIPFEDEAGRVADFHALRHSFITLLERSGISPKLCQELARHSDIRLTMQVYTHAQMHDLAGAVQNLPHLFTSPGKGLAMTGTDGAPGPRLDQTSEFSCGPKCRAAACSETIELQRVDDDCGATMTGDEAKAPPGFEPGMADLQSAALPLG
jgi:hypothetical protein